MSNTAAKRFADDDIDSPMRDDTSSASSPTTPPNLSSTHFTSELSPPDSQQLQATQPGSAPSTFTPPTGTGGGKANTSKKMPPSDKLNTNGKRNWDSNGLIKAGEEKDSGYKWEREEDGPGYSWMNTKAREEAQRAWVQVVEKDRRVGNKYGDVLLK